MKTEYADVMELVDVPDSKSGVGNYVPVRPRPSAFLSKHTFKSCFEGANPKRSFCSVRRERAEAEGATHVIT